MAFRSDASARGRGGLKTKGTFFFFYLSSGHSVYSFLFWIPFMDKAAMSVCPFVTNVPCPAVPIRRERERERERETSPCLSPFLH